MNGEKMLDFRVNTFITVVKKNSFTKAAAVLNLTQPAVSSQIRYLERYYQVKLFDYQNRRLMLTPAGLTLYEKLVAMQVDEAKLLDVLHCQYEAPLRFGATKTAGQYLVAPRVVKLARHHKVEFLIANTRQLCQKLLDGELDFAVVEGYYDKNSFEGVCFDKARYVAIKSPDLELGGPCTIEDVLDLPIFVREEGSGSREILERFLRQSNLNLKAFANINVISDINTIKALVGAGAGISFIYHMAVAKEVEQGKIELLNILDMNLYHDIMFIFNRNSLFKNEYLEIYKLLKEG